MTYNQKEPIMCQNFQIRCHLAKLAFNVAVAPVAFGHAPILNASPQAAAKRGQPFQAWGEAKSIDPSGGSSDVHVSNLAKSQCWVGVIVGGSVSMNSMGAMTA